MEGLMFIDPVPAYGSVVDAMLIDVYVPEAAECGLKLEEAWQVAVARDAEAAMQMEASVMG